MVSGGRGVPVRGCQFVLGGSVGGVYEFFTFVSQFVNVVYSCFGRVASDA